jgi:hypothetical protein
MIYLLIGLVTISEVLMTSIEKITNKRSKKATQSKCKRWDKTISDNTLRAIGFNLPVIVFPTIELIEARFQSVSQTGPFIIIVSH